MSLSPACLKQHVQEDAIAKKWLLRGLLMAAGAHLGLIPLMAFVPPDVIEPPERIELVVTGPTEPVEPLEEMIEEVPPEESVEALTAVIAQAELAAQSQVSGGSSPVPPPPIASFQPAPDPPVTPAEPESTEPEVNEPEASEPVLDAETEEEVAETEEEPSPESETETPTVADTSDEDEPESDDNAESNTEPVETAANNTADAEDTNLDALRDRLRRARERRGSENAGEGEAEETPAAPAGTGDDVARRDGPSEGSGSGSAAGDGDGDSSGSNTVSCRRCDRPAYPDEALESGVEGSPSVSLQYDENGRVIGTVLERSSGNAALDRAAMEAARNYELDSGGRSGSISVEIDFGIEGSQRSRAARQRGERESVTTTAPERTAPETEVVQEPAPAREAATPEPAPTLPPEPEPAPPPKPEPAPPPEPALPPKPAAPVPAPALPPEPAAPMPAPALPPEPEPAPVPDISPPE